MVIWLLWYYCCCDVVVGMVLWLLWCYGCFAGGPEHLNLEIYGPYECVVYALLRFTLAIAVLY